ncbi:hypothetical protein BCR44DRAFT_75941 [Catenaria anguillulae PL171]|uniref:Uncharacterized protein n=1 Tax=Catenaria anguillulae PL171 TaxID=765915 RepID=A0A1Y2HGL1_9FUNG|nr:hypothetical protein BCR44DRAFT_75941 [Catenaria anguillulae PL171]
MDSSVPVYTDIGKVNTTRSQLLIALSQAYALVSRTTGLRRVDYASRPTVAFKVGVLVALYTPVQSNAKKQIAKKLSLAWQFPFRVVKIVSPSTYDLVHVPARNRTHASIHVSRLKPVVARPE